jgi:hypothetical protein
MLPFAASTQQPSCRQLGQSLRRADIVRLFAHSGNRHAMGIANKVNSGHNLQSIIFLQ